MSYKMKKIEEFLEQIEEDSREDSPAKPKPSFSIQLQLLGKWHKKIQIIFSIARDQKYCHDLMKCVVKYIELIVVNLQSTSIKRQLTYSKNFFSKIEALITKEKKDVFIRDVTEKVLELVTDAHVSHWGVIKELLKMYYNIIKGSTPQLRKYTMKQLPDIWLYKSTDSISTFSDYDLQVLIIEIIIFLYGKKYLNSIIRELIPESQELSQQFVGIDPNNFDQDVRNFLNRLNQNTRNVFSIVCDNIKLGEYFCITPLENMEGLWVDFNMINNVISWYCGIGTFDLAEDDKSKACELITLLAEDIDSYIASCSPNGEDVIVKFTLKSRPLNLHDKYKLIMNNTSQCMFMLKHSDDTKKLLSHVLPKIFRAKVIGEEASADNVDFILQSPKRNENLDKSFYGTDVSLKSRDFWELTKSMNASSDSYEAISESNVSQHSKKSQSKSISSKKRLVSPNTTGVFRKSSQVQSLNAIVEESTVHYQIVPDSQEANKTAALQIGTDAFYTAQEEDVQVSLHLDSFDFDACEDEALPSQRAASKIHEKENRLETEPPKRKVGMPLKNYDSSITVSDTIESGADIEASTVENEQKKPRGRRIPLQEQDHNTPVIVRDTAESDEVVKVPASVGFAPAAERSLKTGALTLSELVIEATQEDTTLKKAVRVSSPINHSQRHGAPTLSDAVVAAAPERVQTDSQASADRDRIKVSQTVEECIVEEQHDDVYNLSSSVATLPDKNQGNDDNNNVDMVIDLLTSDTDASTVPFKKKKTLRKLNSTLSEEIQCTGRSATFFPVSLGVSSGDESFVTQCCKEPKRILGRVRSGGTIRKIGRRTQSRIQSITERSRKIARINSSASTEIIEHASKMTRQDVKNMISEKTKHQAMKALSVEETSSEPDASLEDLERMNSSSDDSLFTASHNAPLDKIEKTSKISQAAETNITVNRSIEEDDVRPEKDKAIQTLEIDAKTRDPGPFLEDEIAKPSQGINSSNHDSIFGASSSVRSERIEEKFRRIGQATQSSTAVRSSVHKDVDKTIKNNAPDAFLDDEIAIQLQRMQSSGDEKIDEKSRAQQAINLVRSSVDREAVSKKDKTTKTLTVKENAGESDAFLEDDINSSSGETAIAGNSCAPPKEIDAESRISRQTKNISVVKSSSKDKEVVTPKKEKTTKTRKLKEHSSEDDINSSGDESAIAGNSSAPPKKLDGESRITRQTKTKNISVVKSSRKDKEVATPKKQETVKTSKLKEHSSEDDIGLSSDESAIGGNSSAPPKKVDGESRITRQTKTKNISVVNNSSKDKEVATPKKQETVKTSKLKEHSDEDDIELSSDESAIAGNSSAHLKKIDAESRITRQTKTKNIRVINRSSKYKETATPKKQKTAKTHKLKGHSSEDDINSSGDESVVAANSSPLEKKETKSKVTRQTKAKNVGVGKSSISKRVTVPRKNKTIKILSMGESFSKPDEDEIYSSNDESADDSNAIEKRKMQKSKKTRRTSRQTEFNTQKDNSTDESMLFVRKKKNLRKIESSQTTDGRNSEVSEKVVREKSPEQDVFEKLQDYASENIEAKNYQFEDSPYQEHSSSTVKRKSFVDQLIEKLDVEGWGQMSSKQRNKPKSGDEFDKLRNRFIEQAHLENTCLTEETEHNLGENVLERGKPQSSERVDHTNKNSDSGSKIRILSNVTVVEARRDYQLETILECSGLPEAEENSPNHANSYTEEEIILGTPLENRSSKARQSKPRKINEMETTSADAVDAQNSKVCMKDDAESDTVDQKRVMQGAKAPECPVSEHLGSTYQEMTSTKANSQQIAATIENISVCGSEKSTAKFGAKRTAQSHANQAEIEDKSDGLPDETRNLRKRKNEEQPRSINEDVSEIHTAMNKDKETMRKHAMAKLRKMQDEIRIMTDEEVERTRYRPVEEQFPAIITDTEHIPDIIVHRGANESGPLLTHHAETIKDDVTKNGKDAEDIAIYNTENQAGAMVKRINVEDDVDVKTEYTNSSARSRKRTRKLLDESVVWYDVPVPESSVKPRTASTDEKSVGTNDKIKDATFGSKTTASSVKDKNWKGLSLVINQQPQEETSAFTSKARISPVVLEDSKRKKNETQARSAKRVTFENGKKIKDNALSRLEILEEREKRSGAWSHSRFDHSVGTKLEGLGGFDELMRTLLNEPNYQLEKANKRKSYLKRERVTRKSTSTRLSMRKPLDTVMRGEKGETSPVLRTKRRKRARVDDVTPVFDESPIRIPPIRNLPEGENDSLVHYEKKEHDGYIPEDVEAPEWTANAVQGSKKTELRSSDYIGKKYLLMFFYPSNFGYEVAAPKELEDFSAMIETFKSLNVEVVGCCTHDINVHKELLAQKPNILIPLVADPNHEISMAFRVYLTKWGHNLRAAVFIDPKGTILFRIVGYDETRSIPVDQVLSFVKNYVS